ncbi:LysR family transcriptional regulator, partial [Shinella sp.]|uniref:LysR family transcriptional regulator n=1 Tax=Shinella sp. TaxID=1870904 RepID=UPI0039183F4C
MSFHFIFSDPWRLAMNLLMRQTLPLLELDILRTFVAIAETGNFTTAAETVHRTPS